MRLSKYILLGISLLFAGMLYAQPFQKNDSNIHFLSNAERIYYTPKNVLSSISLSFVKFTNKSAGIKFILTTTKGGKYPEIRLERILLQSGDSIVTIDHPYITTVDTQQDGSLLLSSIHWLSQEIINFLQNEPIKHITFTVNSQPVVINISSKSQKRIIENANLVE